MKTRHGLVVAISAVAAAACWVPTAALANQKCQCDGGEIVDTMDDSEGACEDACSEFGGGQIYAPDAAPSDDSVDEVNVRRPRLDEAAPRR